MLIQSDVTNDNVIPIDVTEFTNKIDSLGPFESCVIVAVGVSGGADSLALCLLAEDWAHARGGHIVALSVDHGLRSESTEEMQQVSTWLNSYNIIHHILNWHGEKPTTGIQSIARKMRYALMCDWCINHDLLYLLLGHHQDDQAETFLLRLSRGSGIDGLASMTHSVYQEKIHLLRPLLDVSHERLIATLNSREQSWIEDPSNTNEIYNRVRFRHNIGPILEKEGIDNRRLATTTIYCDRARQALEVMTNTVMVRAVMLDDRGFALINMKVIKEIPDDIALRLLTRLCRTISGKIYPSRMERLERLFSELRVGIKCRRTFAGCIFVPKSTGLLVYREPSRVESNLFVQAGERILWDCRFTLYLSGQGSGHISGLGHSGWLSIRSKLRNPKIPLEIVASLPTLIDHYGILNVPHLGYKRVNESELKIEQVHFTPKIPLTRINFI
ncbi:MAG: tRNA lysidine(34) synthetase TilS [Rhodospirillaceae bacterium]|jgi:tRNA(Ile)-lysidine synthase|nr:tRNA lysidine(34) synthetase TilS [Rhodospirillaceae bacterium]